MATDRNHSTLTKRRVCASPNTNAQRLALVLDLENLVHDQWVTEDWEGAALIVTGLVHTLQVRGTLVARVAACAAPLALRLAWPMHQAGIRFRVHEGGPDAADLMLIDWLERELPSSCTTVVLATGDHIFAPIAKTLKQAGRRVEVASRPKMLSAELYKAADAYHPITTLDEATG